MARLRESNGSDDGNAAAVGNGKVGLHGRGIAKVSPRRVVPQGGPRSLQQAARRIHSADGLADMMSELILNLATGEVRPELATAMCRAATNLLKVVEMQQRWGLPTRQGGRKVLYLSSLPDRT